MALELVPPLPKERGKRGRGRPRAGFDVTSPKDEKPEELQDHLLNFDAPTKGEQLQQLYDGGPLADGSVYPGWFNCMRCPLGEFRCHAQRGNNEDIVFFSGNPDAHVMIVGEAPGEVEVEQKEAFVGPAGQVMNMLLGQVADDPDIQELQRWYAKVSHNAENSREYHERMFEWRNQEFAITNVVACRPPDNRSPSLPEMKACWERLWNIIYIVDPLLIIAAGNTALVGVTRKMTVQITKERGKIFDAVYDGKLAQVQYPVMPILHPSFLSRVADFRSPTGYYAKTVNDMRAAMRILDTRRQQNFGMPIPRREW